MVPVFYKELGKGLPVVLLHGFCETHEIWNGFDEQLSTHYHLLIPDLPGFGKSESLKEFSIDAVAEQMWRWLQSLSLDQVVLIGHSLGGYVALAMAQQQSSKVKGVVLFHSTALSDTEEKKVNRNRVIEFVSKNGVLPFIDTFVPGLYHQKTPAFLNTSYSIAKQTTREALLHYTAAMRDRPSRIPFLEQTQLPILFMAGEKDALTPLESLQEQAKIAKNGSLSVISEAGHMGMIERPDDCLKAINRFLHLFGE